MPLNNVLDDVLVLEAKIPEMENLESGCPADVSCGDDCTCGDDVK